MLSFVNKVMDRSNTNLTNTEPRWWWYVCMLHCDSKFSLGGQIMAT